MAKTLKFRRGNTEVSAAFTGANGEIFINTDNKTISVHDGTTVGGVTVGSNASLISSGTLNTSRLPSTANVTTAINVGANVNLTTSLINVGNSTVNSTVNSTAINVGANVNLTASVINVGNSTVNSTVNSTAINVGANVSVFASSIKVGNSTVNSSINSSALFVGNSTVNAVVNSSQVTVGSIVIKSETSAITDGDGTALAVGTIVVTNNATGAGKVFVSNGTNLKELAFVS